MTWNGYGRREDTEEEGRDEYGKSRRNKKEDEQEEKRSVEKVDKK